MALLFTLYGCLTNALSQIAYHRWLCYPLVHIVGRIAMLYSIVISANGNPITHI